MRYKFLTPERDTSPGPVKIIKRGSIEPVFATPQRKSRHWKYSTTTELEDLFAVELDAIGVKYRRNASVAGFKPDFLIPAAKLIVEIDGWVHAGKRARKKDERRTVKLLAALPDHGVVRLWNSDVVNKTRTFENLMNDIRSRCGLPQDMVAFVLNTYCEPEVPTDFG